MKTQYQINETSIRIFGSYILADGKPNVGCLVVLFSETAGSEVLRTVTNKYGYYEFNLLKAEFVYGNYQIRFYGSDSIQNYQPKGDWEVLSFVDNVEASLVFNSLPVITIEESDAPGDKKVDINRTEYSTAKFTISNLDISGGEIAYVLVYYCEHIDGMTEEEKKEKLRLFANFKFDLQEGVDIYNLKNEIKILARPTLYDFRIYFIGRNLLYGNQSGSAVVINKESIQFDGIEEFEEYYEVQDLVSKNTNDSETGVLDNAFVQLEWKDYRDLTKAYLPLDAKNGWTGETVPAKITFERAQKITSYVVMMYVTDVNVQPINKYPNKNVNDAGEWYMIGEYDTNNVEIRVPNNEKYVAFWVGCKSKETNKTSQIFANRKLLKY